MRPRTITPPTALLLYFFSILVGLTATSAPVNAATPTPLKILTLNVFAGKREMDFERLSRQISAVRAINADIIALQETYDDRVIEAYRKAFPDYHHFVTGHVPVPTRWSYRALDWTHKALELLSSLTGVARWSRGSRQIFNGDTYGLMILLKNERGTVHAQTQYSERFDVQAGRGLLKLLEAVKPKALQWIQYEVDGVPLLVVNTHLSNGVENTRRAGQHAQLAESLEKRAQEDSGFRQPVLFLADANADESEPEIQWWHTQFKDTAPQGGVTWDDQNPLAQTGNLKEPPQRLDYISTRDSAYHRIEAVNTKTVFNTHGNYISDHNGVVAEVTIHLCQTLLESR